MWPMGLLFKFLIMTDSNNLFTGAFDLLVYTDKDVEVPESWGEDGPQFITNSEEVRLRSFTTSIHKVDAMVAFKK
jgi:mitotic spindle assembly checkpoint protein MAD2